MRVETLVLRIMGGLVWFALIGGACASEGKVEATPQSITQSEQPLEEELPQDITWTTVADEEGVFSISVPSEWETNTNVEELSAEFTALVELGVVPFLMSIDTETGSSLLILVDANHMFAEEPIDVDAYIQVQMDNLKQKAGISGLSTHAVTIDGIKGTQIRYTMMEETLGQSNILIGNQDETRMLCGYVAMVVQGGVVQGVGSDAQSIILEKAIESLRILPTAAGELESCA